MDKKEWWTCLSLGIFAVAGCMVAPSAAASDALGADSAIVTGKPAALPANALAPLAHLDAEPIFAKVPEPWREYFVQARRAEEIADPLERCLAYPDLPGNRWPSGYALAHCQSHFRVLRLSNDDIRGYLDTGDLAGLRARMDAMQARHQAQGTEQGEDIHYFYEDLEADADTDALTARWLTLAPDDAYALLARANYLRRAVWKARGGKYAAEVGQDRWKLVNQYSREAFPLYRRAAEVAPQLMPIYDGALDLAAVTSDDDTKIWAVRQGLQRDPACPTLTKIIINALRPRWGGSYPQMENFQQRIAKHVEQRPLLALWLQEDQADQGGLRVKDEQFDALTLQLLEASILAGANEDALRDAGSTAIYGTDERWKGLAYIVQSVRFQPAHAWSARQVAESLQPMDPAWALLSISRTAVQEPDPAPTQFLLGRTLAATGHFDLAEQAYQRATLDDKLGQRAMTEVASMWLYPVAGRAAAKPKRAEPFVRRLLEAQPQDGAGWIMRFDVYFLLEQEIPDEVVENVIKYADRQDPWQADRAQRLEQAIKGAGNRR